MTDARPAPAGRRDVRRFSTETGKAKPIRWSRDLRDYMTNLVGRGMTMEDAAKAAGVRIKRVRNLATHPEFVREYNKRVEILRASERARNIHKAIEVRDDETLKSPAGRKVQLDAAKWLHGEDGDSRVSARVSVDLTLGYVIDVTGDKAGPVRIIEHEPLPSANASSVNGNRQVIDLESE